MKTGTKNVLFNFIDGEIWKPVVGFEGLYEVSNMQRVKSLKRKKNGLVTPIILRSGLHQFGYPKFTLCKNGKFYYFQLHRLIAEAFIPNPSNLPCINHIDCNPENNDISTLNGVRTRIIPDTPTLRVDWISRERKTVWLN